jgi:acylphosphatase
VNERSRPLPARRYIVEGRVQGVGFRYFVLRTARELGLGGHVRNLPDGRVEVEAAGPPDELAALEERLRQGPPAARVAAVGRQDIEAAGRRTFEIAY